MIIGNERQLKMLDLHVRREALSHAYLFSGMARVGKMAIARAFAKSILCKRRGTGTLASCGTCSDCTLFDSGAHTDVFSLDAPKIGIADVRFLKERALKTSYHITHKIFIIKDISHMSLEAANSFLKLLEEPPGKSVFILIASNQEYVLPTIVSRVWHIKFWPTSEKLLRDGLLQDETGKKKANWEWLRSSAQHLKDREECRIWYTKAILVLRHMMHDELSAPSRYGNARAAALVLRRLIDDAALLERPYANTRLVLESTLLTNF